LPYRKNSLAEESLAEEKNLADTDLKIILLNYQNNYVEHSV